MTIDVIVTTLPPVLDGIGDYTANMVTRLSPSTPIRILTNIGQTPDALPGIPILPVFDIAQTRSVLNIADVVAKHSPDWVLLQYNPFSYGKWGFNPYLSRSLRAIRRKCPDTRVAIMVHETFVPFDSVKTAIMLTWQRWQMGEIARAADILFCSCESWTDQVRSIVRDKPVVTLPVGSNIGVAPISRPEARRRLKIQDDNFVLGVFGVAHLSRMPERVSAAAEAVRAQGLNPVLLYLGPDKEFMASRLGSIPVIADGALPPDEISRRFAAMDLYLAPYSDGVSCRRTAFMTGLQHGIATVGTHGIHTDRMLRAASGRAFLLAEAGNADEFLRHVTCLSGSEELRLQVAQAGAQFYRDEFDREKIADRMLDLLRNQRDGSGVSVRRRED